MLTNAAMDETRDPRPPLRRDAARNRTLLLDAARETFAERGYEGSLDEVAKRAGVGIATLYRRFPSREALIDALFEDKTREYVRAGQAALAEADAWRGFVLFVEHICQMQADDRGFADVVTATFPTGSAPNVAHWIGEAHRLSMEIVDRARRTGAIRQDFCHQDLTWILIAKGAYLEATRNHAPDAWRRYVALILDAVRVTDREDLPAPPTFEQIRRVIGDK